MRGLPEALTHFEIDDAKCWLWRGRLDRDGYGVVYFDGQPRGTHRLAYSILVGEIPEGLTIDHLCKVRACMNPEHLEVVTVAENLARRWGHSGYCKHKHPYTPENTYLRPSGGRDCRACGRARVAAYKRRKSAERSREN